MNHSQALIARAGPELELILRSARTVRSETNVEAIRAVVQSGLDWPHFLDAVEKHRVLPLVNDSLQGIEDSGIPGEVLETLRVRSKISRWRNNVYIEEIVRLNALLAARGIMVIHYKGPVTSAHVYGSPNLRSFSDLDFLVRHEDLNRALETLIEQGYRLPANHDPEAMSFHQRELKEYALRKGPITLEPHWSITARRYPFEVDYAEFWQRATSVNLQGKELLTFSPDDLMLVLAVVGSKSKWERVQKVCDIAECARSSEHLDWMAIHGRAKAAGCERMLLLGLLLARELLDASLPEFLEARIRQDRATGVLAEKVIDGYALRNAAPALLPSAPHVFSSFLFQTRERPKEKLLYLLRTVTTPSTTHMRRMPLPAPLHPLYRVIGPIHDYVAHPIRQVFRRTKRA